MEQKSIRSQGPRTAAVSMKGQSRTNPTLIIEDSAPQGRCPYKAVLQTWSPPGVGAVWCVIVSDSPSLQSGLSYFTVHGQGQGGAGAQGPNQTPSLVVQTRRDKSLEKALTQCYEVLDREVLPWRGVGQSRKIVLSEG